MLKAKHAAGLSVEVDLETFKGVLEEKKTGFIVTARAGIILKKYQYQVFFNEFIFIVQTKEPITIPNEFSVIVAEKIHSPVFVGN